MLGDGGAGLQRFEYKYLITEPQAELVRGFASPYLCPDSHADLWHGNGYTVYSLYLDSQDLRLYHSSVTGEKNRFKLRARWYDGNPKRPVYCEIKARKLDVIVKQRAPVRKDSFERIVSNFCVMPEDLFEGSGGDPGASDRFVELCSKLWARPTVVVRYMREAYVDPGGAPLRLTMDRHLSCLRSQEPTLVTDGPGWIDHEEDRVILEVKFTDTFPAWAREMVRTLNLVRASAAKYVQSIDTLTRCGIGLA